METPIRLKCAKRGARPDAMEAKYTAKLGGTHYVRRDHGVGIPGNRGNRIARTCGKWIGVV